MSTLIKNVLVIDGTNQPPYKADVVVRNEKIVAIGNFAKYKAKEVIDGLGAYLSPGFIDVNTNSDLFLTLFSDPLQEDFLRQGVTTIIGGQNGISLAPLIYGNLELQKYWANPNKINVNWHTFGECLASLNKNKFGVNFGSFIGHSTIREAIAGDDFRDLTQKELDILALIVERAMKEGAFGLSFDLNFPLTSLVPYKEIKTLIEVVKKYNGIFSVRIRAGSDATVYLKNSKENFVSAVNEIVNLAIETGVKTHINNFVCLKGFEKEYAQALEILNEKAATADVYFNMHPFNKSIVPIFSFLPSWAQRGGFAEIQQNVLLDETLNKIKKELPIIKGEDVIIYDLPEFKNLVGKSLKDFSQERGLTVKDGLIELIRLSKLRGSVIYNNLSVKNISKAFVHDRLILSSSLAGFGDNAWHTDLVEHTGAFPKYLEITLADKTMSIELAIKKITSIAAQRLGLKDRGFIKENYFADLTLFREDGKVEMTMINGKIVMREGNVEKILKGKVLSRDPRISR